VSAAARGAAIWAIAALISSALADSPPLAAEPPRYQTKAGASSEVVLCDQTRLQLNTSTQLLASCPEQHPAITLASGEVFIRARNAPIEIKVKRCLIRASYASLDVRAYDKGNFEVLMLEGSARLECSSPQRSIEQLSAGQAISVRSGIISVSALDYLQIELKLAWREHRLEFMNETLGAIVDDLNRYNQTKLTVADPAIRAHRIGGMFAPNDPEEFAATVSLLLGIAVERELTASGAVIRLEPMSVYNKRSHISTTTQTTKEN
jgi:transmembrane sensor